MKRSIISIAIIVCTFYVMILHAKTDNDINASTLISNDTTRLAELDAYWKELARTVKEGDYTGYSAAYHNDAVVVFAGGNNKISVPIETALLNWKQGFIDTKAGKKQDLVDSRFSQRIGNETTAHETGIFHFKSFDRNGKETINSYTHFEMQFVRKNGKWLSIMEYQKKPATKSDWDALQ